ncbi:hypothetical protein ABW19_dt0206169 [Dactylella cylindrospora]|nr:hypothetical protein ABW19_dt0206169 [Dactylella cylindrospora]
MTIYPCFFLSCTMYMRVGLRSDSGVFFGWVVGFPAVPSLFSSSSFLRELGIGSLQASTEKGRKRAEFSPVSLRSPSFFARRIEFFFRGLSNISSYSGLSEPILSPFLGLSITTIGFFLSFLSIKMF